MAAAIRLSQQHSCSLDHLNDPLPRGSSADSGGMSSLATGHAAHRGSRLRRSAFAPSSSPASTIVGSGYPQFSSLRALGLSSGTPMPRRHPFNVYSLMHSTFGSSSAFGRAPGSLILGEVAWISPWPGSESF